MTIKTVVKDCMNVLYPVYIEPGKSIQLKGIAQNRVTPFFYNVTFHPGDVAVYDRYNLIYTGRIVSIGPKTVTIKPRGLPNKRLNLSTFAWLNHDFDLERIERDNAIMSQSI